MPATIKKSPRAGSRAHRAQNAEIEAKLTALRRQEQTMKKKLHTLECSIVAMPARVRENTLRQWNTLPPPEELRAPGRRAKNLPRVHQQRVRQARAQQALTALFLFSVLAAFAAWFFSQVQAQRLLD